MSRDLRRQDILAGDGTRLALFRAGDLAATPVVLMPGTFSNHTFWLGTRGHGFAWSLAEAGFEAAVLDPRGHGASEQHGGRSWRFEDWARVDLPAAVEAVSEGGRRPFLVGHSGGGAAMLMALAVEEELHDRVAGVITLASPLPWLQGWGRLGARAIAATARILGRFPARRLGMGPEDELPGVMRQWMGWAATGRWLGDEGLDYEERIRDVTTPALAVAGAGDPRFAPPHACRALLETTAATDRTFVVAGRETGFSEDFGHAGIVVSRAARTEVWPLLLDWLRERDPVRGGGLPGR